MLDFFKRLVKRGTPASPPLGYAKMALTAPDEVAPAATRPEDFSTRLLALASHVNGKVNRAIKPLREKVDNWTVWPKFGDCDDYVVTKRHELIKEGVHPGALRAAHVVTKSGEDHAVLVLVTTKGDYVMDNINPVVLNRSQCPYKFVSIATGDPLKWVYA